MPLDPQVRALLESAAAEGAPPLELLTPEEGRRDMEASTAQLAPGPTLPVVEDHVVPGADAEVPVRVYRPREGEVLPAVVWFHGGGWVLGGIDTHDGLCRALAAQSRCVVVSVGYRLAPEHRFPAAAEDAWQAARWVSERASTLGVDPARLAVAGDSAGGNLAAVVCLIARERGAPEIAFQALVYPITDCDLDTASYRENADGYMLTRAGMRWFWNHYAPRRADREHPWCSPLRAEDLSGLPRAFVLTAEFDPLRDEGEAYARRLEEAGVDVELERYEGLIHGFLRKRGVLDSAEVGLQDLAARLRAALAAAPEAASPPGEP